MAWPHQMPPHRVALASAALCHIDDAGSLVASSPMGAFYLAGYGPECARKAALTFAMEKEAAELDKAVGHGFDNDAETALAIVCALDPLAVRYTLRGWKGRAPILKDWKEHVRYGKSDAIGEQRARRMLEAARELVEEVTTAL